jgi:DNA-binding MarR family transcriptional regulator
MKFNVFPQRDELLDMEFIDEHQKFRANLMLTSSWMKNLLNDILRTHDLTATQFNALYILFKLDGKPISTLHLRGQMLDKMSDTPKIVDRLLRKNLVRKRTCATDRRMVDITITDAGKTLVGEVLAEKDNFAKITEVLTPDEVLVMNKLLSRLRTRE